MWRAITVVAAVIAAGACSGGGDDAASDSSSGGLTTVTQQSPEDAFLAEIETRIASQTGDFTGALEIAQRVCSTLDAATEGLASDDAPNDSPQTDASIGAEITTLSLDLVMETDLEDQATAEIMSVGAEHLCPAHTQVIADYLASRGINVG